jgi:hypothetical protein
VEWLNLPPRGINSPGGETVLFPYVTIRFWSTAGVKPFGVWAEASWSTVAISVREDNCILALNCQVSCMNYFVGLVFGKLPDF